MTAFRYRSLSQGSADAVTAGQWRNQEVQVQNTAGQVYEINAKEGIEERDELIRLLKLGRLMPSDLVFSGGIWRTFAEAPEFYEECEGLFDSRGYEMKLDSVLYGGAGSVGHDPVGHHEALGSLVAALALAPLSAPL